MVLPVNDVIANDDAAVATGAVVAAADGAAVADTDATNHNQPQQFGSLATLFSHKYFPRDLSSFIGNDTIRLLFNYYLTINNFPNMIISGPFGTGKTTLVQLFVKQFLGSCFSSHSLEIYGSLYKGRCIINTSSEPNKVSSDKGIPNLLNFMKKTSHCRDKPKVVIIYDFDYTAIETQMSLRRIIEDPSSNVKFIFTCNARDNISEEIQSRLHSYYLEKINDNDIRRLLTDTIIVQEKPHLDWITDDIIESIIRHADGNIRVAINTLQLIGKEPMSLERFNKIINLPIEAKIESLYLAACLDQDEEAAIEHIHQIMDNGYSLIDILNLMLKTIINSRHHKFEEVSIKNKIIETISRFFLINETSLTVTNIYAIVYSLLAILPSNKNSNSDISKSNN